MSLITYVCIVVLMLLSVRILAAKSLEEVSVLVAARITCCIEGCPARL
jgi:hypothetical protein